MNEDHIFQVLKNKTRYITLIEILNAAIKFRMNSTVTVINS